MHSAARNWIAQTRRKKSMFLSWKRFGFFLSHLDIWTYCLDYIYMVLVDGCGDANANCADGMNAEHPFHLLYESSRSRVQKSNRQVIWTWRLKLVVVLCLAALTFRNSLESTWQSSFHFMLTIRFALYSHSFDRELCDFNKLPAPYFLNYYACV